MLKTGNIIQSGPYAGFEVIDVYSRADAIEDGLLIDVSETAKEAGIVFPVAVTNTVWETYIVPDERSRKWGQSESGRLWDTVWMLRCAIKRYPSGTDTIHYSLYYIMKEKQRRLVRLKAICGPGDNGEPVITIMLPEED